MDSTAKLTFKVMNGNDQTKSERPHWIEVEAENAICPECHGQMTVIIGEVLYAHCVPCKKYFIGS
jgi:hypothetical protein